MMKKLFFIPLLLVSGWCAGQVAAVPNTNTLANRKPAISSPNAAAIEKYIEFPTANYTGVPDISIPVYEIKTKGFSLPVVLSYHASGIKVDELASDVGLGWSLMAGGVINIMQNGGMLDEVSGFPLTDPTNFNKIKNHSLNSGFSGGVLDCSVAALFQDPLGPDPYGVYAGPDIDLMRGSVNEAADAEPDMYSFSFGSQSGKFFPDENGVFRTIPYSEMKIERILENNLPAGYKITDEGGNVFEFKYQALSAEMTVDPSNPYSASNKQSRSYYLTKITTVYGEVIDFAYSPGNFCPVTQQISLSRSKTPQQSSCWQMNSNGEYFSISTNVNTQYMANAQLQTITSYDGTQVKFIYSADDRKDIPGQTKYLDKIEVWSLSPVLKKVNEFSLAHSYFGNSQSSNTNESRLKLTGVTETGKPATQFLYNSTELPQRLSYSQDHFGYFNGKSNNSGYSNTLLPKDEYMEFWEGADRSIDPAYTQAGMLTKVIHTTGGSTEFIYEPNEYWVSNTTTAYPKVVAASLYSQPNQTVSTQVTVPSNARKIRLTYNNSFDGKDFNVDYCIIHLTGPNGFSQDFLGNSTLNTPPLNLVPGLYTLSIENVGSTYSASATMFWFAETQVAPHNEMGGGVRIKEIRKYDGNGTLALSRSFEYKKPGTSESSGVYNFTPSYITYNDRTIHLQNGNHASYCTSTYCQLITQNSGSIGPLTFANGSPVLYSDVTTYERTKEGSGYTEFKYLIGLNGSNLGLPALPYAPRVPYDWANGSLLQKKDYGYINNQFTLLKKTVNTYNYTDFDPGIHTTGLVKGYGAKIAPQEPAFICWSACVTSSPGQNPPIYTFYEPISFGVQYYNFYSSFHHLDKTEETIYDITGNNPQLVTTNYYYDNPNSSKLTRTESINSKGEVKIQKMTYPKDYAAYGFIQTLLNKNMVGAPVEKYSIRKDASNNQFVLGGEISTYNTTTGFPEQVYGLENISPIALGSFTPSSMNSSGLFSRDNNYGLKVLLNSYDSKGNILSLQKLSDIQYGYVWDYNQSKPVAEVSNGALPDIAATSFEADGTGNWTAPWFMPKDNTSSITGKQSYSLTYGSLSKTGLNSTKTYIVSYWSKSGQQSVNGTSATTGRSLNGWTYYEHKVINPSGGTITVSGSGTIDELRLYPAKAQMVTYTYDPQIGMTSQCDANNRITYYEYDNLNRLALVRDQDNNILKKICYNYAGQTVNCSGASGGGCTNTNPDWQNTAIAVRCQVNGSGQNTGYQEQEQKDMNSCSSTYNQLRWVQTTYNPAACPTPVTITSTNYAGQSGYTASYTNNSTNQTYTFSIPSAVGLQTLGSIPAGTYTLTISKPGGNWWLLFGSGCSGQTMEGLSATFYNINVATSTCNSITIDGI